MINLKRMILLSYLWLPFSLYASYEVEWRKFIELPDSSKTFSYLLYVIKDDAKLCNWGKELNQIVIPQKYGQSLYKLISKGNKNAFNIGISIKKCLDGGELEDYLISMGLFFEKKPLNFLKALHKQNLSLDEAIRIVIITPSFATDDFKQQINILEKRLLILESLCKYENKCKIIKKNLKKIISDRKILRP